jgi:hypothetical protein
MSTIYNNTPKKLILTNIASVIASLSMCICCALPALLLVLGGGPFLATIFSIFPKLFLLEKNSTLIFIISGSLILTSGLLKLRNKNKLCPDTLIEEKSCLDLKCLNKYLYIFSISLFIFGTLFNFILPKFL